MLLPAMRRRLRHRRADAAAASLWRIPSTVGAVLAVALTGAASVSARVAHSAAPVSVSITGASVGPAVAAGFVGLATEYWDIEKEVGTDPTDPDVPFEQVARNLAPSGGLSFRIGGDSTDWTWWPVAGRRQPPWVRWTMTPTWAAVTQKLAEDLQAKMIFGINMESDSTAIARAEVSEIASQVGSSVPTTYEIGNEPELYPKFPFYRTRHGQPVYGRPKSYTYSDITADWKRIAAALPGVTLAGPGYSGLSALPYVAQFLDKARRLSLLTVHTYPLKSTRCGAGTLQEGMLFQPSSLQELAAEVRPWTSVARRHGTPVRVDEMNSVTCGGMPNFSDTFGPALWALNILPLYAQDGVEGVNFQTKPLSAQNLIQTDDTPSGWRVHVQPEYYGLLAFAQLTPPGSHMLKLSAPQSGLYAWAVSTPSQQTNVVLTNVTAAPTTVRLRVAGARGPGTMKVLRAGSGGLRATGRVSLGGQTISPTTGQLTGLPVTTTVPASQGTYEVRVPAGTAEIVTFVSQ
jgi:hypothetical protein